MQYHLSRRQLKELANGKQLRIAIPHPEEEPDDYAAWAREILDVDPAWVVAARADSLPVIRDDVAGDVAAQVGSIVRDQSRLDLSERLIYYVEVVIADVTARGRPRAKYPPQWPGAWTV